MARKRNTASRFASSRVADDLKLITGIGPAFEKSLHEAGIRTFARLAKLSPEDVATHISKLSAHQIRNQGWISQARKLANDKAGSKSRNKEATGLPSSQHYENFTLEFLLTEKNKIRRVRIMHVQGGDVDSWTRWNSDEVSNFLARHTKARFPKRRIPREKFSPSKIETVVEIPKSSATVPRETDQREYLAPITFRSVTHPSSREKSSQPKHLTDENDLMTKGEKVRLLKWINSTTGSNQPVQSMPRDKSFDVNLTLDISSLPITTKSQVDITGTLLAKKLGTHERRVIGETQVILPFSPTINLRVGKLNLEQGLYRLEAQIKTNGSDIASLQGGLFQVY